MVIPFDQDPILGYFSYKHLPKPLRRIAKPFRKLAKTIARAVKVETDVSSLTWPDRDEARVALRKLLEAKDAAVRAFLMDVK